MVDFTFFGVKAIKVFTTRRNIPEGSFRGVYYSRLVEILAMQEEEEDG